MKRLFLQKAHKLDLENKHKNDVSGKIMSEKYDGIRAFWDGGISRGMKCSDVPWANITKDKREHTATGLWSMNAKAIFAPDWWLDRMPDFPVDGELWKGRGRHQETRSAVAKFEPVDSEWQEVQLAVFDSPNLGDILYDGIIDTPTHYAEFENIEDWCYDRGISWEHKWMFLDGDYKFSNTLDFLISKNINNQHVFMVPQMYVQHIEQVTSFYRNTVNLKGEGIVLRDPNARYEAGRSHNVLKGKPYLDAEAIVVGYRTGRATSKGSKLLGLMGSLLVEWNSKQFLLSGFTDAERQLISTDTIYLNPRDRLEAAEEWAKYFPDRDCPEDIEAVHFPRGSKVTFKYRELSDDGIPKEASYLRTRTEIEG